MGTTWEVWYYVPHPTSPFVYRWDEVYRGQSLVKAVIAAVREKRRYGGGCIRIEWR